MLDYASPPEENFDLTLLVAVRKLDIFGHCTSQECILCIAERCFLRTGGCWIFALRKASTQSCTSGWIMFAYPVRNYALYAGFAHPWDQRYSARC